MAHDSALMATNVGAGAMPLNAVGAVVWSSDRIRSEASSVELSALMSKVADAARTRNVDAMPWRSR